MVIQKVGNHAGGAGHGQSGDNYSISSRNLAAVQANIATPRLAPSWKRELMHVSSKIADSVKTRGRSVRDDRVVGIVESGPGRRRGGELKPGRAQAQMVRPPGAANAVDAMRHPFQSLIVDQARDRRVADSGLLCLAAGDQPPLTIRNLRQPLHWLCHAAKYTVIRWFCR